VDLIYRSGMDMVAETTMAVFPVAATAVVGPGVVAVLVVVVVVDLVAKVLFVIVC
jgi:hypothetical protein